VVDYGIVNVYKEKGYTSHDAAAILRKLTGIKAGHTGTLDPNAQGVLPICLGRATKLADYIMAGDKTYIAEVIPGITTDTGDMTGKVLSRCGADISAEAFNKTVAGFIGEQWQTPPMYSAVKRGGKKLYELARKGETIERDPRRVVINEIQVLTREEAAALGCAGDDAGGIPSCRFFISVSCSKGTYIRSLCADIGEKLGCGAAMGELTRTRSGVFHANGAVKIGELREAAQSGRLHEYVLPVDAVLPFPRAEVNAAGLKPALNGNTLPLSLVTKADKQPLNADAENNGDNTKRNYWLYTPDGLRIGLFALTPDGDRLRPEVML
jgi:tRNA pseudouridine55 synthase